MNKKVLISTGGSGGHVVPGTIFYEHLKDNFDVHICSDQRGAQFLNKEKYKVLKLLILPIYQRIYFYYHFKYF